jgi:hypothetical protein
MGVTSRGHKRYPKGWKHATARKAGAILSPTASQSWDRTRRAGLMSLVRGTSGHVCGEASRVGGEPLPKEIPGDAPNGADSARLPSSSLGWLTVGESPRRLATAVASDKANSRRSTPMPPRRLGRNGARAILLC